jgi:hypothetical protein
MATPSNPVEPTSSAAKGFLGIFTSVFSSARQVLGNFVELVTLEARRAGITLVWMVALGVVVAMLVVTAWLALMAAFALWLASHGMTLAGAIALVAAVNLIVAAILGVVCFAISRNLLFPATRRQLKPRSPPSDAA